MNTNLSVWDYYKRDNSKFIDPLYVPYQRKNVLKEDGQICQVNTWKTQGSNVNDGLVRNGWGLNFQLLHPDDPCPNGWVKGSEGWCFKHTPEYGENGLYSKHAFIAKNQYWDGHTKGSSRNTPRKHNGFDNRSINPWTNQYIVHQESNPSKSRDKYNLMSFKDSYLS